MSESLPQMDPQRLLGQNEKLRTENQKLWQLVKERSAADEHTQSIIATLQELVPARPEVPPARLRKLGRGVLRTAGILDLGDWHYGEVVDAEATGGVACYDTEIAKARFDFTIDEAIRLGRFYGINHLDVVLGGDMISGNIHDDLNRHNEVMVIEQTLGMAEVAYGGLEKLCQAFAKVRVHGVSGNHARMEKIPYFKQKQVENLDYMMYKLLEHKGRDQANLEFNIPRSFWTIFETEGRRFLTMHGDTNRHQNSMGISFYAVEKELRKWQGMAHTGTIPHFHDIISHHLHTAATIPVGEAIAWINGSGKGQDEYTQAGTRPPSRAQQRFLAVGEGAVRGSHLIDLEHIGKPDALQHSL